MAIRMLLAKIGIDAHDRGIKFLAYTLRDAGLEVIYTGPWQTIDAITKTAIQEDVDIIGINTLGGDYILIPKLLERLKEAEVNIPVIVGGIIPADIEENLKKVGIAAIFHPGASTESIVGAINLILKQPKVEAAKGGSRAAKG